MVTLGPVVAKVCTRAGPAVSCDYAEQNDEAVEVLSLVIERCGADATIVSDAELGRLTAACRELRNLFDRSAIWTSRCHLRVANLRTLGEHFSTFLLARYIFTQRTHAHLTRNILQGLGAGPESQLLSSNTVTEVFVCETPQDEQAFWTKSFASALRTSAVPTISQVDQLRSALAIILAIGMQDDAEPMATVKEIVEMACADGSNSVLRAVVFSLLCDPELLRTAESGASDLDKCNSTREYAAGYLDAYKALDLASIKQLAATAAAPTLAAGRDTGSGEAAAQAKAAQDARLSKLNEATSTGGEKPETPVGVSRAPSLIGDGGSALLADVGSAKMALGFLHGLTVDDITDEKWQLKKKGLPMATQRAFLDAFMGFSFVQLCDFWRARGLWKVFFRSTHMSKLILKQAAAVERAADAQSGPAANRLRELRKVGFFLSALHEEKYPKSPAEFKAANWACRIVEPMRGMCAHPLFAAHDPSWLLPEFQQELAGKKLKLPMRNSVAAVLSREGNTGATWLKLFEADAVTVPQIFANLRSLALAEFPVGKVKQLILAKIKTGAASAGFTELMRIRTLLSTGMFTESEVEGLRARIQGSRQQQQQRGSCRVEGIGMSFRDKRGQASTQQKNKNIGWSFGMETVEGYQEMAQSLLEEHLNAQAPAAPGTVAAVVLTHELRDNLVRTGIPPRTPPYSPASLWRGEALALQRLDAVSDQEPQPKPEPEAHDKAALQSTFENLIVGITWCEHPQTETEHKWVQVDLDLSVVAFDVNWQKLCQCSYTALKAPGMTHSGDLTSAPHPGGAREDVRVSLSQLPTGTRYLALTVHNYTRQPMDECCADASVFVASAHPGLGPGGLDIISSAAMKGKGTNVLCGVLHLAGEDSAVHRFICCDQQMLNGTATELAGNSVETTTDLVGRTALSVLSSSGLGDAPTKPRLTEIAAFASTSIADTVLIEHAGSAGGGGAGENLAVLQREDSESRYEFASRVRETLSGLEPTAAPCYPFRASLRDAAVSPERLVVFGGELEQKDATRLLTAVALPQHKTRPQPTVVLVNLRSNQEQVERRTVGRSNPYWAVLVGGADVAPAVQSALKEVADEVEAKAKAAEQEKAKKAAQQDGDAASSSRTCTTSSKPAKLQPVSEPTGAAAAAEEETEATKQERQKWAKRMKYTLGMVFVAEFDAVPVQVSKQLDSPAVRIGGGNDGPVLLLDKDELMQAVGMDITSSGPAGSKSVPRVKIDCRSLIALRTDAEELAPEPIDGWVSVYSAQPPGGGKGKGKGRPDAIISAVPKQHVKMGVRAILEARGGYVEPSELLRAAATPGVVAAAPKVDKEVHTALTSLCDGGEDSDGSEDMDGGGDGGA